MRDIDYIVFHCTATSQNTKVSSIKKYWKEKLGWKNPGYHLIIEPNGNLVQLAPFHMVVNGVRGHNHNSIHVSYIGGKNEDDRTSDQIRTQKTVLKLLRQFYKDAKIMGHRDFEGVKKSCPRFDVQTLLLK